MNTPTRIAAVAAVALALSTTALANQRDLAGQPVDLESEGTLVVFWSMDCATCVEALGELAESDVPVVAVNTDPVQVRSEVRPYLEVRGIDLTVVQDSDGSLQRRFSTSEGALVTGDEGQVAWRGDVGSAKTQERPTAVASSGD